MTKCSYGRHCVLVRPTLALCCSSVRPHPCLKRPRVRPWRFCPRATHLKPLRGSFVNLVCGSTVKGSTRKPHPCQHCLELTANPLWFWQGRNPPEPLPSETSLFFGMVLKFLVFGRVEHGLLLISYGCNAFQKIIRK